MDKLSLPELIKDYIYTRMSLQQDPNDKTLLLEAAALSMRMGLYRTTVELCSRCLTQEPGCEEGANLLDRARNFLLSITANDCVIATDREGFVILVDRAANALKKMSSEGELIWNIDKEGFEDDALYNPDCLAVNYTGDIYVGSSVLSRIQVFSTEGTFRKAFAVPKKFGPKVRISSLACDELGNLWIMDSLSGLLRLLNPEGDEIVTVPVEV